MSAKLDDYILTLGQPGKMQCIGAGLLMISFMHSIGLNYILAFITMTPDHNCLLPQNSSWSKNESIPHKILPTGIVYDKCHMYVDPGNHSYGLKKCENGYEFMPSDVMRYTIATEWNLVCEEKYLIRIFQTLYFVGIMIGGGLFGYLSDVYGRRKIWVIASLVEAALEIPLRFLTSFEAYCALAVLHGIFIQGQTTASYSALMELFPGRFRTFSSVMSLAIPSMSVSFGTVISYLIPYWRNQMLCHGLFALVPLLGIYFVKENVRWLVVNQRVKEANEVSKAYASFNGIVLPKDNEDTIKVLADDVALTLHSHKKQSLIDLMRYSYLRKILFILCASMFVAQLCVYGFNFLISEMGGNVYVNFLALSVCEFTLRMLAYFGVEKIGRRLCTSFTLMITGSMNLVFLVLKAYQDTHPTLALLLIAVGLIGRIFNGVYFITSLIQATEILPTTVRSTASGAIIATGRLGLLLLPAILLLGDYLWSQLPFLIFGVLGVGIGLLCLLLPETKGRVLPNTIEEAQQYSKSKKMKKLRDHPEEARTTDVGQPMLDKIM